MSLTTLPAAVTASNVTETIEILELETALAVPLSSLQGEWQELFDTTQQAGILHHPEYTVRELPSLRGLSGQGFAVCYRRAGRLLGLAVCLPKVSSLRYVGGLGPNANVAGYRLVGNSILAGDDLVIHETLLQRATAEVTRRGGRYLLLEDVTAETPLMTHIQQLTTQGYMTYSPSGLQDRFKIDLPATSAEFWARFSSKTRNTWKRKQKKLGNFRVWRVSHLDQIADFLRDAHAISQHTWQSDKFGMRVRNDDDELRMFTFLAQQGALRSYLLYVDEKPVAFLIGNQHQGLYRYEEVGYHRDYGHLSPGLVLLNNVIEEMYADHPPRVFDFGYGDADYKRIFANQQSQAANIWIVPGRLSNRGLVGYLNSCRSIRKLGKKLVNHCQTQLSAWKKRFARTPKPTAENAAQPEKTSDDA